MLVWENQGFDLEGIRFSQPATDIDAQCVSYQLSIQVSAQILEDTNVALLDVKLSRKFTVHGLYDEAYTITPS